MADIVELLKEEIGWRFLSIIFDSKTRLGEAMAIVLRYVDKEWVIQQRLVCPKLLEKRKLHELSFTPSLESI